MKGLAATAAAAALVLAPTLAEAGFIHSRAKWNDLTPGQQRAYAMGAYDALVIRWSFDTKEEDERKSNFDRCLKAAGIMDSDLAQVIQEGYARETVRWALPASVVLYAELVKICPQSGKAP